MRNDIDLYTHLDVISFGIGMSGWKWGFNFVVDFLFWTLDIGTLYEG